MEQSGTIEKALEILLHLHRAGSACGVSELGRALGLPKSTAHRLLQSLGRKSLVERDDGGRYRNGIGLVALGRGVLERETLLRAARPALEESASRLGETCFVAAARAGRLFVLDKEEGGGLLRVAPGIGDEVPVDRTGVGKLYLAFAPDQLGASRTPESTGANASVEQARFAREIENARERGWAQNLDEWVPGLVAFSVPVFVEGSLTATLAAAGPSSRIGSDAAPRFVRQLQSAARGISLRIGDAPGSAG